MQQPRPLAGARPPWRRLRVPPGGGPSRGGQTLGPSPTRHEGAPCRPSTPQPPRRRGQWHQDRASTAQELACTPGPLRRLHPQRLLEGGSLWARAPGGTPSDTAAPADRAAQAHELAWGKTFPPQRAPAGWAGRPSARSLGPFGQHLVDNMESQQSCSRPHGQAELGQRRRFFDRPEQLLPAGSIMTFAVAEA